MIFYHFIQNFVGDETPLGKLATCINQDEDLPMEETTAHNILNYFNQLNYFDDDCIEAVKRSLSLYEQSKVAL
ncbi:sterile alpha motif-like domain-containing protein [Staphylococcus epidermidis]|mgnify:FL=1|uniref:sterile alpha motif-like domain-containing protein n=1 Tax=Staphylococcus epidermidis TaxID=1282 RepID=UPI0011A26C5C|nr:sterile alpha motif-like domain-containing protein [Staphylococcus epidermidis]